MAIPHNRRRLPQACALVRNDIFFKFRKFFVRLSPFLRLISEGGESVTEFESIYRQYFSDVELYLRAICRDEHLAEDLTAQVFFQALKALPKFRGDCDIRTWL